MVLDGTSKGSFERKNGAPGGDRTPDPLLRRQLLYPLSYQGSQCHIIYHKYAENQPLILFFFEKIPFPACNEGRIQVNYSVFNINNCM